MINYKKAIKGAILGSAVGDALGVPVEFKSREYLREHPVTDMIGYGTYNQPPGTWSDDTSMTLCLLDQMTEGELDQEGLNGLMDKFNSWYEKGEYTAHGKIFDIGNTTQFALIKHRQGVEPLLCGLESESSNGNGSLMRVLPLAFITRNPRVRDRNLIKSVSCLTHAHPRSFIACQTYIAIAEQLQNYKEKQKEIIQNALSHVMFVSDYFLFQEHPEEKEHFSRLLDIEAFKNLPEEEIQSSGYVMHTLEAAIWCLLNTSSYKECVLKAVNLGGDTDTVAAVAGGLAGIVYGIESIPEEWLNKLAKREYIEELCENFAQWRF